MGECFFWYRPTRVVPDKRPLNGCLCVCVCVCLSDCKGWNDGRAEEAVKHVKPGSAIAKVYHSEGRVRVSVRVWL